MPDQPNAAPPHTIACPFCGLGCDDLSPSRRSGRLAVNAHGCARAEVAFAAALMAPEAGPRIDGRAASLDQALTEAAALLAGARLPLFAGLCGDVTDLRGALHLAARTGGALDHRNGAALISNLSVLEETGWMVTSLGEVRNRADLIVLVGNDLTARFPRLRERILQPAERLHAAAGATFVEVHTAADDTGRAGASIANRSEAATSRPQPAAEIALRSGQLRDFIGVLRAHLANRSLEGDPYPGAAALAERLSAAAYPVIAFSAADLQSESQPDLAVRALAALVRQLNQNGRAALLPLGGADGESSAHQVSAWHTGFGVRQQFQGGVPRYEPRRGDAQRLLDRDGADLLFWISSLSDEPPPVTTVPTVVLGHPAMTLDREPEIFIPLAVPGVHRAGAVHRGDGLALLPLTALVETGLPTSADVLTRLLGLLPAHSLDPTGETPRPC
jgi:formylmethanofuran dehydrogenase subunit B